VEAAGPAEDEAYHVVEAFGSPVVDVEPDGGEDAVADLRIVLAVLTKAGSRERVAREIHRSISSVTWSRLRSPAKMARNASFSV
jgi:hypothetical protein